MRFLFAIDNLRHGGAQKVLRAVLRRLDRRRVLPVIWRLGGGSEIESWYSDLGVPVIAYPEAQMRTGIGPARMLAWMMWRRPVLVQTFLFHADVVGRVLARAAGVPAVVSSVRATNVDKAAWQFLMDRATAPLAHRIIAVSSATRDFALAHEGARPEQTVVIPNGIDLDGLEPGRGRQEARAELGYSEGDFVVGAVGRFHEQKGHAYLVDAVARLAPDYPRLRAFFVGYGPLESRMRAQIARSGLEGRVRLLGYRKDAARLLAAMDAFVLPSLWEGMSNALLEAMAMATPVVATGVDGNLEVVENGRSGILVPPRDSAALASAVRRLMDSPKGAAAMGRRARERVARDFSLRNTTDAYLDLYEELLARKTRIPLGRLRLREDANG